MKQFFSLNDLTNDEVTSVLALAKELQQNPSNDWLRGKVMGLLFMAPSLRTLASFQAGIGQMGGTTFVIQPGAGSWNLEFANGTRMTGDKQEHVKEAIPVLSGYCDAIGIRRFADGKSVATDLEDGVMRQLADLCTSPFVNMESAADHPCQALADWKTLDDAQIPAKGGKFVLSWAYHPKALTYAVPRAALNMAAKRGMEVTIAHPKGFDLPASMIAEAQALASSPIQFSHDPVEAMAGAHVIYAKSWSSSLSYCEPAFHAHATRGLESWCVDEPWFEKAEKDAKFMHCLPVRRNVKVSDAVLDGPRSLVQIEANNRLHVQKAIVAKLLGVAS